MAATHLFGVSLAEVLSRPHERTIPGFFKRTIRFLNSEAIDTEGLFRIASKPSLLMELKQRIDAGEDIDFSSLNDPHLAAGLLKTYLRELPEPLFTFDLYPEFVAAAVEHEKVANSARNRTDQSEFTSGTDRYVEHLGQLVERLPPTNKALTEILLLFLARVGERSARNKMTPANLAIVFGQILLRPKVETIESMMNASRITGIMKFMIEKYDVIFPKQKPKRNKRNNTDASSSSALPGDKQSDDAEKLEKLKETVNDAISLVQHKLLIMQQQLHQSDALDASVDIARRIRTAKKVLFPPGQEPRIAQTPNPTPNTQVIVAEPSNCNLVVESGHHSEIGKRKTMEDFFVIFDDLRETFPNLYFGHKWSLYAVFDGHGGPETAKLCHEILPTNIVSRPSFGLFDFYRAFSEGFERTDSAILQESRNRNFKDGSTAVVCLIHNDILYVANVGDSEAVIGRVGADGYYEAAVMTEIHRANEEKEKQRIEAEGGAVFSGRVFGSLAVSRAFGDSDFKKPSQEANFVISEPFMNKATLTDSDHFLIMGCDGVWDKISHQEAVDLAGTCFNQNMTAEQTASEIAKEALTRGSGDNITVIIVRLLREYDEEEVLEEDDQAAN